ncbi:Hypothetical protein PFCIRM119_08855 [Propionibacterium freudenreichii]|uniref:Uncharacterized protein n=2 Tax=Propionibacterium freudenreichii TaxID=1744 RepID=D7GDA1_PROFC|nr:Hypothetical protein PFREUD_09870 [Propionibacterium freudenreichii subsp. shermanii CIRM-BIA1]CDP48386.1 Hypothetical protein PFCIRM129_02925 [Propionibacterium freudenreichii subsp. freudenreichii]CEG85656.1 Hypothetical protein PFCIRM118_02390 [Propionibacterium freudenreichii]CEG88650.1 Hypothetical protein PFCIRM119_08855 [Propionibacterium freudenreichii]CEG89674.1 Hypothetical protein PFCIRM121_09080 [Propionibacterium freudenreichii]
MYLVDTQIGSVTGPAYGGRRDE